MFQLRRVNPEVEPKVTPNAVIGIILGTSALVMAVSAILLAEGNIDIWAFWVIVFMSEIGIVFLLFARFSCYKDAFEHTFLTLLHPGRWV